MLAIDDPSLADLLREGRRDGLDVTLIRSQRALTDCRPLALISIQTIRQLSQEVGVEVDKRQFRANVYIDLAAGAAFCEDAWVGRTLQIGATTEIARTARDSRCKMITLDPDTSRANPDVMRRVSEQHDGTVGVYAAVLVEGTVRAGDEITLLD